MHLLTKLAKETVETFLQKGQIIHPPENFPKEFLNKRAGTFVTIEDKGQLRGCIGTYLPTRENIAEEVIYNAINAACGDYRFSPIGEKELPDLSYTIYILSEPELIRNIFELNPKEYGIIVKSNPIAEEKNEENNMFREKVSFGGQIQYKTGLLLPDLDGVDTVEKQISIACEKAGINPEKEKISIYKFTVQKYQ